MLITTEIEETYDINSHSQAGYHKISNIIHSILVNERQVVVISPLSVTESSFIHKAPQKYSHPENGATIIIPRLLNVYDISIINESFVIIFTTIEVFKQVVIKETSMILYYNQIPSSAIPATIGSIISNSSLILEYEDEYITTPSIIWKLALKFTRIISGPWIDGAICVNALLAERASTRNTMIFRGFPSVGLPEDLPHVECDKSNPIVMYAGKFDRLRGVHTYIDMIKNYNGKKCEFWISGWGKEEEIDRINQRLELMNDDRIKFFGQLPFSEYQKRCIQADVLINPQDPDHPQSQYTFPSKILDFLSSNSLVITTDMADLKSEMSDILIINGNSAESLSETLNITMKMDQTSIHKQKKNGQQWVRDHCVYERVGRNIIELGAV